MVTSGDVRVYMTLTDFRQVLQVWDFHGLKSHNRKSLNWSCPADRLTDVSFITIIVISLLTACVAMPTGVFLRMFTRFFCFVFRRWRKSTKPVWSILSGSRGTTLASSPGSTQNRLHYPASHSLSLASSVQRAWRILMRAPWLRPRRERTATNTDDTRWHTHCQEDHTHP